MIEGAHLAGFDWATFRLFTDWVRRGLLDIGTNVGKGEGGGRGARYLWPEDQFQLFLVLLRYRPTVKNVAGLCNFPVGNWLYGGDDCVPLRQVRRALLTWWARTSRTTWDRSHAVARELVRSLAPEGATRAQRRELRELALWIIESGQPDREALAGMIAELARVCPLSVFGGFKGTAQDLANGIVSMMVAMTRYEELTDGMFLEARFRLRSAALSYVIEYPQLLANPDNAIATLEQPTLEWLFNGACKQLLLGLGMQLIAVDEHRDLGPVDLTPWDSPPMILESLPMRPTT
jgi:hypothetical protein